MIAVEDLHKDFDGARAVAGLSFSVARGEIYGLIGPNGAGKTTTLRMIAGLLRPTAGRLVVGGVRIAGGDTRAVRARVGYVTGTTGIYARLTVAELLDYFGKLHGTAAGALRARRAALADALDLTRIMDRRCEHLSTGERQRVSLARAVFHDPPVLVLDEPTAGLDVVASRFALDFVRGARDRGAAVLFSTHYLTEAELLCDRVGLLHRGRLVDEGAPAEVKARAGAATLEEALLRVIGEGA